MATNHKPEIPGGGDQALWDRLHLIPFTVRIPPEETVPLAKMLASLRSELPGILAWAVRGCLEYQRRGLAPPDEVKAAVSDYRAEQDIIGEFLEEECQIGAGEMAYSGELYRRFAAWSERQGVKRPMGNRAFGRRMSDHGYDAGKDHSGRFWLGLSLKSDGRDVCDMNDP